MPLAVMHKAGAKPVKIWAPIHEVESKALDQLYNTAKLPCIFHHVAAMPDVHLGVGATVGSVVATKGALIPAAVGVDIGCGMMAVQLPYTSRHLPDNLATLRSVIEEGVPLGHVAHAKQTQASIQWNGWRDFKDLHKSVQCEYPTAQRQLGTLGGGNHFIEVCLDTNDQVWIMLHSGSRKIGKVTADAHITKAKDLMRQYMIGLPDPHLAYLVEGTNEFDAYWRDLQWCQQYAKANREAMMAHVLKAFGMVVVKGRVADPLCTVNCHHNYAERENHYSENVIVTRKGAVRARTGDLGIIPGSMGTRSYIVEGLGNADSFHSCSHGAGRRMSRGEAKRTFTLADIATQTAGIECKKDESILDELPGAYKDIDQVMENQKDLVRVVAQLRQVLCVKG